MSRRVLVIGAKSFVGRALVQELRASLLYDVVGATRASHPGGIALDLLNVGSIHQAVEDVGPAVVFNLAGPLRDATIADTVKVQVQGTANLLEVLRRRAPGAITVLLGSAAEYGPRSRKDSCKEDDPLCPQSNYAMGKVLQTHLAQYWRAETSHPVMIARLFNAVGPGQPTGFIASDMIERCRTAAEPVQVRDAESTRDLIDVRDVASALRVIGEKGTHSVYNIGSGSSVSVQEIAEHIAGFMGATLHFAEQVIAPTFSLAACERLQSLGWKPAFDWRRSLSEQIEVQLSVGSPNIM